jgi:hypothetical protein
MARRGTRGDGGGSGMGNLAWAVGAGGVGSGVRV